MLATGGSACLAVEKIKEVGVPEENIIFANLVASREGIKVLGSRFPLLRIVTAAIDDDLTASK
jgi:uracil phosphoribosyltransferase